MTDTITPIDPIPEFGGMAVRQPRPFKIDGEVFYVAGSQPAGILFEMAELSGQKDVGAQVKLVLRLLKGLLIPESYDRFVERMKSQTNPITIEQVMKVVNWSMEAYSDRPTSPGTPSSVPSETIGTSLTAGVPVGM